jgi:hypothetical protein
MIQTPDSREVMERPGADLRGSKNSRMKLGQTTAGRYLQIVYVPDEDPRSAFVITNADDEETEIPAGVE